MDSFLSRTPSGRESSIAAIIETASEIPDRQNLPFVESSTSKTPKRKRITTADATWQHTRKPQGSEPLLALPELPGIDGPGSHSGAEQWKLLQPVIEEYGISRQLGYITGDNHGSNDVLCRLLSHFLDG
ncbi:hypothetical protein BFJ68_g16833 [Fusarium oxysporum]|uniref:Uncharacterized protein n=1 Tax=Fusarium oxysporum TaxID=5507 RepID=A0A420P8V1_FUSOX|nr:hypothetical protein BFJ68_g16833 [Fusarium oxysporum]